MNTRIKEVIARKKNPQKYDFEVFQRELEKQRTDSIKELLTLQPIIDFLKQKVTELVAPVEELIISEVSKAILSFQKTAEDTYNTLHDIIYTEFSTTQRKLKDIEQEGKAIVSFTKEELSSLDARINDIESGLRSRIDAVFANTERFKGEKGDPGVGIKGDKGDSVDKEEVVASILESVKPEILAIRKEIQRISTAKQSNGGGGMGNIQHETKPLTAGTTSVNTSYAVAGGGYAIWAYYQGQLVMRGTHYTVSGKTITLLFTPEDGASLDIIYHR